MQLGDTVRITGRSRHAGRLATVTAIARQLDVRLLGPPPAETVRVNPTNVEPVHDVNADEASIEHVLDEHQDELLHQLRGVSSGSLAEKLDQLSSGKSHRPRNPGGANGASRANPDNDLRTGLAREHGSYLAPGEPYIVRVTELDDAGGRLGKPPPPLDGTVRFASATAPDAKRRSGSKRAVTENTEKLSNEEVQHLTAEWQRARRGREYELADDLRARLREQGVEPDQALSPAAGRRQSAAHGDGATASVADTPALRELVREWDAARTSRSYDRADTLRAAIRAQGAEPEDILNIMWYESGADEDAAGSGAEPASRVATSLELTPDLHLSHMNANPAGKVLVVDYCGIPEIPQELGLSVVSQKWGASVEAVAEIRRQFDAAEAERRKPQAPFVNPLCSPTAFPQLSDVGSSPPRAAVKIGGATPWAAK